MGSITSYLQTHWQGRHSFGLIVLVNLLLFRFALHIGGTLLPNPPDVFVVALVVVSNLILLTWQIIGVWRRSDRLSRHGDTITGWALYAVLLVVAILACLQVIDIISRHYSHRISPVPYVERQLPQSTDGTTAYIKGPIDYTYYTALRKLIATDPRLKRIDLHSEGGSIFAGRALALLILNAGLDTQTAGPCFSACTLAFVAGENRVLKPGGQMGFHSYRLVGNYKMPVANIAQEEEKDRVYFLSRGISTGFVDQIFNFSSDDLWRPPHRALLKNGVITGY